MEKKYGAREVAVFGQELQVVLNSLLSLGALGNGDG